MSHGSEQANLPNMRMRRTPARTPVTHQNSSGLNQSLHSTQSWMGNNYCIFKKIFLAIGGGGGGSRSCRGLEGGCDTGRYCCGLLCCHLIDLLSHPRSTALITVQFVSNYFLICSQLVPPQSRTQKTENNNYRAFITNIFLKIKKRWN